MWWFSSSCSFSVTEFGWSVVPRPETPPSRRRSQMSWKYERCYSGSSLQWALNDFPVNLHFWCDSACIPLCFHCDPGVPAGCSRWVRTTDQLVCSAVRRLWARLYTACKTGGQSSALSFTRSCFNLDCTEYDHMLSCNSVFFNIAIQTVGKGRSLLLQAKVNDF